MATHAAQEKEAKRTGTKGAKQGQQGHARDGASNSSTREERLLRHGRSTLVQATAPSLIVKSGGIFGLSAENGDIDAQINKAYGIYFHDTRFLSRATFRLEGQPLSILLATDHQGDRSITEMTNPEITLPDGTELPKETISVRRERRLTDRLEESIAIKNFSSDALELTASLAFAADFENMFVVRGADEGKRGTMRDPRWSGDSLTFEYDGADGRVRTMALTLKPGPDHRDGGHVRYNCTVDPRATFEIHIEGILEDKGDGGLESQPGSRKNVPAPFGEVRVTTDNALFNEVLAKSFADLRMLLTKEHGDTFFAAGVPWYVALFGRDSIIAALQTVAFDPGIAATTLRVLAQYQGQKEDAWRDEEPGKILHELRVGEKAHLNEVPQTPYYGTVDATPLFIVLADEYMQWTNDESLWQDVKDNVGRALAWIDGYGDSDGDGFVDYKSNSAKGLANQGWKDSGNSITNGDGSIAQPPVALVEVQGYVYRAKLAAARLYERAGDPDRGKKLREEAGDLKKRFAEAYWSGKRKTLVTALEKSGKQADSLTSNPGQAMWTGIVSEEHAGAVTGILMSDAMYSGWGVRTMAEGEAAYNPIDYQVGSVWPHDNSLIAAGLKRYGQDDAFLRIFSGLFQAATRFPHYRLPEVFAGFSRSNYNTPVHYPVACNPQAWAAGALPFLLRTGLGLEPNAPANTLTIRRPILPEWLGAVDISNLRVGTSRVNLHYERVSGVTLVALTKREGDVRVVIRY